MTQPAKSQEPSMEEILASIRRIIADDDANKSQGGVEAPKSAAPVRPTAPPPPPPAPPPRAVMPEPSPTELKSNEIEIDEGDAEEQSADILDLTESMAAPVPPPPPSPPPRVAPSFRKIEGEADVRFDEAPEQAPPQPSLEEHSRLLSRATSVAVNSAFNSLAQTVLVQNARTLEDLVREMLRPLLKVWLDENLAGIVERLVRAEIERVSRGR